MKIANKISLSLTLTGAMLAFIAVSIIYIAVRNNLEKEILQHLITAAQSRANHIETFFDAHKNAVEIMSSEPSFIEVLSMSKNNPEYDKKLETVSNRIKTLINVHKEIFRVNLLDKNGVVVVSTDEASVGFDSSADVTYLKAKEATYVRDINISEAAGIPVIGIATPVLFNSEFLGVIIADLKAEDLYKITLDRTGLGETGEIYLVNQDFYMISPSRFKEDVILKQKVDTVNARRWLEPENKDYIEGLEKINVFPDYRGVNVLGAHAHIHEMQWGLLAEIDENEAHAPLKQITSIFVAILIVIPIAGWLASIFFARLITRPVHRLHKGTEIIGQGNLEYKVGTDSKDEIGQLSRAFDKMTEDLKKTTASMIDLNREIDERKQAEEMLQESEEVLKESEKELSIRNRVAEVFIKIPDDKMYFEVLQVVLETMESPYGTFAYINENGDRVVPTLTRDIWVDCEVQDADIVFPRERWSGIWGKCLINKEAVISSGPFRVPEGHVPITKSMAVPIIYQGEAIGNFMVANKTTDYGEQDKELLETIADYMAPILRVRLQRDRQEEKRKQAEESLQKRTYDLNERVKELNCLYSISNLIEKPDITLEAIFQGVVEIIPPSWQYPEITCSRIILEGNELKFRTPEMAQIHLKHRLERLNSAENLH